jgi:hypothetical protein
MNNSEQKPKINSNSNCNRVLRCNCMSPAIFIAGCCKLKRVRLGRSRISNYAIFYVSLDTERRER